MALLRSDHNTHSFTGGDRYVKLAFERRNDDRHHGRGDDESKLRVLAPSLPAQAVPGIYMLYVVDKNGVPSVGRQIRIKPETDGRRGHD